ncbi:hypothetical protein KIPB_008851, partial [Kipferlia bialata]|eukprot:g8851.t1
MAQEPDMASKMVDDLLDMNAMPNYTSDIPWEQHPFFMTKDDNITQEDVDDNPYLQGIQATLYDGTPSEIFDQCKETGNKLLQQ